jgi:hypothetical protein
MSLYQVTLFLHVAGAIATFVGVGAWFFGIVALRRARRVEEIMILAPIYQMGGAFGLLGIVVVAVTGLDLALSAWSLRVGWIQVAIGAFALLAPVGPFVVAPRMERIIREARMASDGPVAPALLARQGDPVLKLGLHVIIGDLVGIVFLMTAKLSFGGSIVAILGFIGLSLALALPPVGKATSMVVESFARLEESSPLYRRSRDRQ